MSAIESKDENSDDERPPTIFRLTGVDTSLSMVTLEDSLTKILQSKDEKVSSVTVLETDFDNERILFSVYHPASCDDRCVLEAIQSRIACGPPDDSFWSGTSSPSIEVLVEDEHDSSSCCCCVEYISEEEAYALWLETQDEPKDSIDLVTSPDGDLILPKHHETTTTDQETPEEHHSETSKQLIRDPTLLECDNLRRVHYSKLLESPGLWKNFRTEPIVICGLPDDCQQLDRFRENLQETIRLHGPTTIVRTGNRETLVQSGFHHSRATTLSNTHKDSIVFNPIHELPAAFRETSVLGQWMERKTGVVFPNTLWEALLNKEGDCSYPPKFTLCMANEGFGIGMHKHGPALFFLTSGRKKWYLSHPDPIDALTESTHPRFYQDLSSHKCIQEPGELLFVPNLWYHEIYNLSSPTIGIQALAEERNTPGDTPL